MANKGTRGTAIDFGGYEISVSFVKATKSRDLKTEYVNADGKTVTMSGGAGGDRRTPAPGVEKAVRVSDTKVVRLPTEALEQIVENSKEQYETMRVLETIDYRRVPTERIIGTYYLQPRAGTGKGCRMLFDALKRTDLGAVVKWVGSSREKLGVIRARTIHGKSVLHLSELSFANDTLEPDDDIALDDIEVGEQAVVAAMTLVDGFRGQRGVFRQIDAATDTAVDARLALLESLMDDDLAASIPPGVDRETGEVLA